jgi:UDP-glucuronate 4-epimerase
MATAGRWELEEHVGSERYLVTGGLGCIGAWTLRNLVRSGADVVSFDLGAVHRRPDLIMTPEELAAVTFVQGDITRKEDIDSVLDENQITRVIHLAALQFPFCKADPVLGSQVNVVGTVNVFQAAAERRDQIAKIVYASSVATFDESDDDGGPVSSDQQGNPVSLYGVFKYWAQAVDRIRRGARPRPNLYADEGDARCRPGGPLRDLFRGTSAISTGI